MPSPRLSRALIPTLLAFVCLLAACYRPGATVSPRAPGADFGAIADQALENRRGVILVIEPRAGRIIKRVARGADLQFESSPFELAQIVTAYLALTSGRIDERTTFPCDEGGATLDVVGALSRPCPGFFREASRGLTREAFIEAASDLGFTYFGIDYSQQSSVTLRPVRARFEVGENPSALALLAAEGVGMVARDLHYAQLISSLATGTTPAERLANYVTTTVRAPAAPTRPLDRAALAVIRRALVRAVDNGEAMGAASIEETVSGKSGDGAGEALFISFAPSPDPRLALVIYLHQASGREAAEAAGKFYRAYFRK
jgi:hypothetical protein